MILLGIAGLTVDAEDLIARAVSGLNVSSDEFEVLRCSADSWKTSSSAAPGNAAKDFLPGTGWQISQRPQASAAFSRLEPDGAAPGRSLWHVEAEQPAVFRYSFLAPFQLKDYKIRIECCGSGSISLKYGIRGGKTTMLQTCPVTASRQTLTWSVPRAGITKLTDLQKQRESFLEITVQGKIAIQCLTVTGKTYPTIKISGVLEDLSPIPAHTSGEYPDCFQVGTFAVSNVFPQQPFPQKISCNFLSIIDQKRNAFAYLKKGAILDLYVLPFSTLSDAEQGTMQLDTLNQFELESYFVLGFTRRTFLPESDLQSAEPQKYVSIFSTPMNPPQTARAETGREETIRRELQLAEARYAEGCRNFAARKSAIAEELSAADKKYQVMGKIQKLGSSVKSDGSDLLWTKIGKSFFALPKKYMPYLNSFRESMTQTPHYLDSFKALNDFCKSHNVHLIVVLIPDLYEVSARKMLSTMHDIPNLNLMKDQLYLLRNGIEAIDPTQEILSPENQDELSFLYPENGHPGWGCQNAVAKILLQRLQRYDLKPKFTADAFSASMEPGWGTKTYCWPEKVEVAPHTAESIILQRTIHLKGPEGLNIFTDETSPVLLCGNSYIESPMNKASLSLRLAELSGVLPHNFFCGDSGVSSRLPRTLSREYPKYLKNKKVMILSCSYYCLHNYTWTNVRTEDEQMIFLGKTEAVSEFQPLQNAPEDVIRSTTLREICFGEDVIADVSGKKTIFVPPELQKKYGDGGYFLQIRIAGSHNASLTLLADDRQIPVEKGYLHPTWQTIIIPYKKGMNITVAGKGVFALKKIKLLRERSR